MTYVIKYAKCGTCPFGHCTCHIYGRENLINERTKSKEPMDIILNQEALVRDLNGENIVLHKAIAIKNEEIAGLKMALAQAEIIIERMKYKCTDDFFDDKKPDYFANVRASAAKLGETIDEYYAARKRWENEK